MLTALLAQCRLHSHMVVLLRSREVACGVQVYLSAEAAAATEVVSSKSSSMSVTVLPEDAEAEPAEHPVPEQFMSKVVDGKLVTVPISHV